MHALIYTNTKLKESNMNFAYSSVLRHGKNLFQNNRFYHEIACKMRYLTPSGSGVIQ